MLVVAETPGNFQVGSVAVVVVVASMAVLILDEWRLVIEVPNEMSDMHARKAQKEKKGRNHTGVRSSSMSPAAEAAWSAASIRSSHRFPKSAEGSAERAFRSLPGLYRSSFCIRRNQSAAEPREFFFL